MKYRSLVIGGLIFLLLGLFGAVIGADPARASAVFTVDSTIDEPDASPGDGLCASTPSGVCTLRAAVMEANELTGTDTITLPAGAYTLTLPGTGENAGLTGDLDISSAIAIQGAGPGLTIVDGNRLDRVFDINDYVTSLTTLVTMTGLTIRGGALGYPYHPTAIGQGGGIWNGESLWLTNSSVVSNVASIESVLEPGSGGGIFNSGVVTIENSTVEDNATAQGAWQGGGIYNKGGLLVINSSRVVRNHDADGGGISSITGTVVLDHVLISENDRKGITTNGTTLTMTNSTVTSNTQTGVVAYGFITISNSSIVSNTYPNANVGGSGAGITVPCCRAEYELTLINSTVSGNYNGNLSTSAGGIFIHMGKLFLFNVTVTSNTVGGGVNSAGGVYTYCCGMVEFQNTVISGNMDLSGQAPNCAGIALISHGYNLISDTTGCTITGTATGNLLGINSNLDLLQNNGGPTLTHMLLPGSPVIDAGNPAGCTDHRGNLLTTDQRGVARPQGPACDIGAVERVPDCGTGGLPSSLPFKLYLPLLLQGSFILCP